MKKKEITATNCPIIKSGPPTKPVKYKKTKIAGSIERISLLVTPDSHVIVCTFTTTGYHYFSIGVNCHSISTFNTISTGRIVMSSVSRAIEGGIQAAACIVAPDSHIVVRAIMTNR